MKNKHIFKVVIFTIIISFPTLIPAFSECELDLPCVAYSKADSVFIGQLVKFVVHEQYGAKIVVAHYKVEKTFKGINKTIEIIQFPIGGCMMTLKSFKKGESYLVYKNKPNNILENCCGRTSLVSAATDDLKYLNNLSVTKPRYTIHSFINGLSFKDTEKVEIFVETGKESIKISHDKFGQFNFSTKEFREFKLKILVPFEAIAFSQKPTTYTTKNEITTIVIFPKLAPNDCEVFQITIQRSSDIAIANLTGKVVNKMGEPISRALLYLHPYPYIPSQELEITKYKLARTNDNGEFQFNKLKNGKYILGVNISGLPNYETPYERGFFPGVSALEQTTIIEILDYKDVNLENFVFSDKLKTIKVSGRLLWRNGNPVLSSTSDREVKLNPFVYLIDPTTLERVVSSFTGTHSIKVDGLGNFHFFGYEGYEYIVNAQGENSDGIELQAKHKIIKVTENHPFIELFLNQEGKRKVDKTIIDNLKVNNVINKNMCN